MKNDPRYVCHHRMSLVNKQTSSPLKIFKQESVRFLSNADDNCQVWLVSDGTGFQDLVCPRGISAIYFMTFHYNINVLGDRFYVLTFLSPGKKPPNKKSTTFVASTDPSNRLYSNFYFLFKNLRVKTLAFQT